MGSVPPAPFNTFAHATQLAGPQDTFVSINNDTVYSIAQLDVSGPVRLKVPDADGRYYVLPFRPAERDLEFQQQFAPIGLLDADCPYRDSDTELADALRDGLALGRKNLEDALTHGASPEVNGWKLTYHVFDYNLDFFEVGAINDQAWKLENPKVRYVDRALSGRAGLWGNHGYEAAYAMTWDDGDGQTWTATAATGFASRPPHSSVRSGRSRCTTSRTFTSSPTRSTATRLAIAPPA
jgi:hypothetical protein